jgi:DNA processing protein
MYDDDERFPDWSRECSGGGGSGDDCSFVDYDGGIREIGRNDLPPGMVRLLGNSAPEKLSCCGDLSLLGGRMVMVCGARDASPEALDLAYRCGRLLADSGVTVASGYARGVDLAAHRGAFEAGGATVAILPYGLARFRVHRSLADAFDPERFLAVSELPSWGVFTARSALRRNKFLAALAGAVIVVEPGESGGTWYSAEKASVMEKPLFFLEGARPEIIPRMEALGGKRLEVRNGTPDIGAVIPG